jgi:membrane-associated phospholipid phosphatase
VERIAENAHYLSDVIGGAGLGTLSAYLAYWGSRRLVRPAEMPCAAPEAEHATHAPAEPEPFAPATTGGRAIPS